MIMFIMLCWQKASEAPKVTGKFWRAHQTRIHPLVLHTEHTVLPKSFTSANIALLKEHFQKKTSFASKTFQITPAPAKKLIYLWF